ncbi:hypothetical protein M011DRAFT_93973 [Sporormia fimetaria CBS 119925]|uniref:Uncharacterized protein n=1 Tax=Sporormia fimetaria CBS 119925 TaxID=1340428 RepID=A0A6A6V8F9_9PLEO|nr:hypothetical protein M011DRAFT_93973 [Sporormia fimetaria CBS 119925]
MRSSTTPAESRQRHQPFLASRTYAGALLHYASWDTEVLDSGKRPKIDISLVISAAIGCCCTCYNFRNHRESGNLREKVAIEDGQSYAVNIPPHQRAAIPTRGFLCNTVEKAPAKSISRALKHIRTEHSSELAHPPSDISANQRPVSFTMLMCQVRRNSGPGNWTCGSSAGPFAGRV